LQISERRPRRRGPSRTRGVAVSLRMQLDGNVSKSGRKRTGQDLAWTGETDEKTGGRGLRELRMKRGSQSR